MRVPVALFLIALFALEGTRSDAQWIKWNDANGNHQWSDPANWLPARVPGKGDDGVDLASLPGPTITETIAEVKSFVSIGTGHDAMLTIGDGGRLTANVAVSLGCTNGVTGTLVMQPNSHLAANQVYIGNGGRAFGGKGRLILNGGTIKCTHFSVLRARALHSEAHVTLNDGVIDCWDFYLNRDSIIPPRVDLRRGKIVQRRNDVARIRGWIHSKWIVAYNGKGDVHVVFDPPEHPDCTLVWATLRPPGHESDARPQPTTNGSNHRDPTPSDPAAP